MLKVILIVKGSEALSIQIRNLIKWEVSYHMEMAGLKAYCTSSTISEFNRLRKGRAHQGPNQVVGRTHHFANLKVIGPQSAQRNLWIKLRTKALQYILN